MRTLKTILLLQKELSINHQTSIELLNEFGNIDGVITKIIEKKFNDHVTNINLCIMFPDRIYISFNNDMRQVSTYISHDDIRNYNLTRILNVI